MPRKQRPIVDGLPANTPFQKDLSAGTADVTSEGWHGASTGGSKSSGDASTGWSSDWNPVKIRPALQKKPSKLPYWKPSVHWFMGSKKKWLRRCRRLWYIAGEKEEANPIVIEDKIRQLETEFDRLLVLAADENDVIDYKLKEINESILKLKQQKERIECTEEHSKAMEAKTKEVMGLISADDIDLAEYSDSLVYRIVERITVLSKEEIRIRFVGGFEITKSLH